MEILNNNRIYKKNDQIEVRYLAKGKESGLTDLFLIVTNTNGVDLSPALMTELSPGLYRAFFTPNVIGYWQARAVSISSPINIYSQSYFVVEAYPNYVTADVSFLNSFQYSESNAESSTTAITPQNKLTFIWTPQAIGEYMVEWYFQITNSSAKTSHYQVQLNSVDIASAHINIATTYAVNGWIPIMGFTKILLSPISQIFTIDFWAGSTTAYIRNTRLKIYRVA